MSLLKYKPKGLKMAKANRFFWPQKVKDQKK